MSGGSVPQDAKLLLAAKSGGPMIRHVYGMDEPSADAAGSYVVGIRVDMKRIRDAVKLSASKCKMLFTSPSAGGLTQRSRSSHNFSDCRWPCRLQQFGNYTISAFAALLRQNV
jgi:hypothetical protein